LRHNASLADAPWYLRNIPFLEIDDPELQTVYYYRWKVFRSHIREIGPAGTTVLEFLDNVPWARQPATDLNDSASLHILEGRWLRDPAIIDSLIDHIRALKSQCTNGQPSLVQPNKLMPSVGIPPLSPS
jgi:hypothetical protein